MPEIHSKTLHSYSTEDPQFPAKNLLETKVTKKWKCQAAGEKSSFVVLKLDQPRIISGIDIGNERSSFIEVLVGNSKQDPPDFKEILLATSFMTIVEAKNETNPNRVRFFTNNLLVESVAKQKWDLVKVVCTQPFNNKIKYGISFITLHTPEAIENNDSPVKTPVSAKPVEKIENSSEKKRKFGKFTIRGSDSDSDDGKDKKEISSPFDRWKSSKSGAKDTKTSIKESVKAKIEENRKRIRIMSDSSDEEVQKPKANPKPSRNRTTGLMYVDEDDEPNDRLQKKLDKDKETREKEQKTPKSISSREKESDSKKSKFASFIDEPSTSSRDKSPHRSTSKSSSSRDKSSPRSSSKSSSSHKSSSHNSSSRSSHHHSHSPKKPETPKKSETAKKSDANPSKPVSYKPFGKLLEGVTFAFSGYVNPERGILRSKALDMGAKYKPDWDSSCTHLICAFMSTPKYQQVKGKGKIVTKRWIEACFSEQKKLPWRRYALDNADKDEPESEEEIHNVLSKPKSSSQPVEADLESDEDMVVVDKRVKNGNESKPEKELDKSIDKSTDSIEIIEPEYIAPIEIDDDEPEAVKPDEKNAMEVSTDDDLINNNNDESNDSHCEKPVFKGKSFYLNEDLPATDVLKLKDQITSLQGRVTERSSKADYIITLKGRNLPKGVSGEVLTSLWISECYEMEAYIPTTRYKIH